MAHPLIDSWCCIGLSCFNEDSHTESAVVSYTNVFICLGHPQVHHIFWSSNLLQLLMFMLLTRHMHMIDAWWWYLGELLLFWNKHMINAWSWCLGELLLFWHSRNYNRSEHLCLLDIFKFHFSTMLSWVDCNQSFHCKHCSSR